MPIVCCLHVHARKFQSDTLIQNTIDSFPNISIDDFVDLSDATEDISSVLAGARDPYLQTVSYNFANVRFRFRGYDADYATTYINGLLVDKLDNGYFPFSSIIGLTDIMRNRDNKIGLQTNTFSYGDIGSATQFLVKASMAKKQVQVKYGYTNRTYRQQIAFSIASGNKKNNWATIFSAAVRYSHEGYVPGTHYRSISFYWGIDKRFSFKHLLSFAIFNASSANAKQGASTDELLLYGGHYYNPYWGYQNGQKRNAEIITQHAPTFILTHDYTPKNNIQWTTAIGYSFNQKGLSGLDWYNTADPHPDYYRYLPSYEKNPNQQLILESLFRDDESIRQINWGRLYQTNQDNLIQFGQTTGRRSLYIIDESIIQSNIGYATTTFNKRLKNNIAFTGGLQLQVQRNRNFKIIKDLLGGDFFIDWNQFAQNSSQTNPSAIQNDLNRPNRIVKKGDQYSYDYLIYFYRASSFLQLVVPLKTIDIQVASEFSEQYFYRVGRTKYGLFPDNSYGKSTTYPFFNWSVKGGITYKINGRYYLYANSTFLTKAPFYDNVYLSPKTRNSVQDKIVNEHIVSSEIGFIANTPIIRARLSAYYTEVKNQLDVVNFFDDDINNFVNYVLSGINKVYTGVELGLEYKILSTLSLQFATTYSRYVYKTNMQALTVIDNTQEVAPAPETVYCKNFRIGGTPQELYSLGLRYQSPLYWYVSLTVNYWDHLWLSFNPVRRTTRAIEDLVSFDESGNEVYSPLYYQIINQTKLDGQFTLNATAGYSWKLPKQWFKKSMYINLNVLLNNMLDNKNTKVSGYEQLRFDFANKNVDKFPNKYLYGYGINFSISAALRM